MLVWTETASVEFRRECSSICSPGLQECSLLPPPLSSSKAGGGITTSFKGRPALVDDSRNLLWPTTVFQSDGCKTRGTLSFSSQNTLQCPSLFAHCLKSETQVLHFIIENKIFHITPELGMLSSRTMFLDVTQLMYTALFSTEYWRTGKT